MDPTRLLASAACQLSCACSQSSPAHCPPAGCSAGVHFLMLSVFVLTVPHSQPPTHAPTHPQILEECGYDVPLDRIRLVTSYLSGGWGLL